MAVERKVAFVTGVTGQDGAHLAKRLLDEGWTVYGGFRRGSSNKTWRMNYLGIDKRVTLVECQLNELQNIIEILQTAQPTRIYNLAGESFVADSFKYPGVTLEINAIGTLNVLEAVKLVAPQARVFCASSSEIFKPRTDGQLLEENSICAPSNPYGISKLAGQNFVRLYRERYNLFACSGILFNHEGPLRGREYVTRKIAFNIARLKVEGGPPMALGDLNASRDWGAAIDYVGAMQAMLEIDHPEDLIVATGRLTTVREFLGMAARAAGYDPVFEGGGLEETCVDARSGTVLAQVASRYFRAHDTPPLSGDASRLRKLTGWVGSRTIETLAEEMVAADVDRWKKGITNV
ncbi:MAG: NAD-dependent epimerase/dehydratase family protein [Burkholderiales bacterium]|nr:NAD-dependent epimerase/dehydratase family protein [Burkholderiales bacterium]